MAHARWYAVKLFERDERVMAQCNFSCPDCKDALETAIASVEKELDDDSESIITNERYAYIAKLMKTCVRKKQLWPIDRAIRSTGLSQTAGWPCQSLWLSCLPSIMSR